jgi:hypothetical protein
MIPAIKDRKLNALTARMASGHRVLNYSLTDPEVAAAAAAFRDGLERSPEKRIELLKKAGIFNQSGKTAKKFGG